MITIRLFLIQLFATIAVILINSILIYAYFNYIIVDLLPSYMILNIPLYAIFATLFAIYLFVNNLRIPFADYSAIETPDQIEEFIKEEITDITVHLLQSTFLTAALIIFMSIFA